MINFKLSKCDKFTYKALAQYECQTSQQISNTIKRLDGEAFSPNSVGASLRKMESVGVAASSLNEKSQKVYWITEFGAVRTKDFEVIE